MAETVASGPNVTQYFFVNFMLQMVTGMQASGGVYDGV